MKYSSEAQRYRALADWLEQAEELIRDFVAAGLPVPDPLLRVRASALNEQTGPSIILPPTPPRKPPFAEKDWLFIEAGRIASVRTLLLAIIRQAHPGALSAREVIERVTSIKPDQNPGSVYNAAKVLEREGRISRIAKEWRYAGTDNTDPVLVEDQRELFVWGPVQTFTLQDMAAHRRDAIRRVLEAHRGGGGLMQSQIVDQLKRLEWLRGPVSKDLVKMDIEAMIGNEIRRSGNSRKLTIKDS